MDAGGGPEAAGNGGIEGSADPCSSGAAGGHRLSVHQIAGGGKVVQFIRVKVAELLNRQPRPLPELVLSEEMVSNAAASFRVKVNNMLMIAHDITLGKDFRLFFQVVLVLWLLSVIGNFCSSITLAYIGTIALVTVPALYNKYQGHVDRYAGMVHRNISRHYKIVDENVISRLPRSFITEKED
nr:unnamed protein product [Digitaria exilis]